MTTHLLVTVLFLIPILLLLNEDIRWEKMALSAISSVGDVTSVRAKLEVLSRGSERDYENFRLRQLALIAVTTIPIATLLLAWSRSFTFVFLMSALLTSAVIIATERQLGNHVKVYRARIESDFPSIVEMITLSLSAGETPLSALQRISKSSDSPLSREFSHVVAQVKAGVPFMQALDEMGRRVDAVVVRRFIDAIVVAISRGAPLIDVLHSHAREARDFQRNQLLSAAGKAEMSMMIPVVFLILPISILFALWPSLTGLNLFATGP